MPLDILKGLTPVRKRGSNANVGGFNTYPITNGYASNIGEGDPVKLSAGVIQLADNDSKCLGVFKGVRYIDSEGKLQFKNSFVAGTSSQSGKEVEGGYTQPLAYIFDDPDQTYVIRTHASALALTNVGSSFKVSAIGSVVGTRSQAVLQTTSAGTSVGDGHMVTVIGLYTGQSSEWGTGPIAVEVKLSRHGYVAEL